MMKKYLIILFLIVGCISINAQDQGVLSLSQLSSANATDAYYVSTVDSGDFHVRWSTLYNDVYNYYPDRLTGLDTVDNNYYLIVNKDSVAYKIKWSIFLDSLNVDVYDSTRSIVNDTADVLRIEWRADINDSLGRFWDSVEVKSYVNDTLDYYIDSVSIIDTIQSIINDSLGRFWDSVEVKSYVNDTLDYYIDSTATIDTIQSIINDSLGRFWDSVEVKNYVNDTLDYYIDSTATIDTIRSIISDSADSFTLDYVTSKGNTTTNDITIDDITLDTANVLSEILFSDGSSIDQAKVDSAYFADTSGVAYETKYSRNITDILWFGDVYGDTGNFNRIIVNDLEIKDVVESLKTDGETYITFGKDDHTPLWEFQRDGDNLDLYSNISGSEVRFDDDGSVRASMFYFDNDPEQTGFKYISYDSVNYYSAANRIGTITAEIWKFKNIEMFNGGGNISNVNILTANKVKANIPYDSVGSNSLTIPCDSSGYHETSITGDLTINFTPLPASGEVSEQTIFVNVDASDRALTIQQGGVAIDSTYWIYGDYIDTLRANSKYVIPFTINSSGIKAATHDKIGN